MEYTKQEFGGGSKERDFLVRYESYLDNEIRKKLEADNFEEKAHKYVKEIAEAKTTEELNILADKWGIQRLQK